MVLGWNADFPKTDREFKVGLYIETKMYGFYLENYGIDIAEKVYEILKKYDLDTVEKATEKMPIIIECFEKESLVKFGTLSDLPLI
jgi:glycerophosphoryl diester phosphodiesterase